MGNVIQEDSYRGTQDDVASRNRYNYAQNNPYKYSDPSGHAAWEEAMASATNKTGWIGNNYYENGSLKASGTSRSQYDVTFYGIITNKTAFFQGRAGATNMLKTGWYDNGYGSTVYYENGQPKVYKDQYGAPLTQNARLLDWNSYNKLTAQELKNNPVDWDRVWKDAGITPRPTENVAVPIYIQVEKTTPDSPMIDISELSVQTQKLVSETAQAINVSEYTMRQILMARLTVAELLMPKGSLEDRIAVLCDIIAKEAMGGERAYEYWQEYSNEIRNLPNVWQDGVDERTAGGVILNGMAHYNQRGDDVINQPLYNENGVATNTFEFGCNFVAFAVVNSRYNGDIGLLKLRDSLKGKVKTASWDQEGLARETGLQSKKIYKKEKPIPLTQIKQLIKKCLDKGHPVILHVNMRATDTEHFCVAYGYKGDTILIDTVAHSSREGQSLDRYVIEENGRLKGKVLNMWVFWK